ncbi:probable transcription factor At4g00390 [Mangifera indica]|uniref:probable transcription factor At4g00390 n=1 Tax=Mangifera indica TaxID=29780 RepID=UPI001CFBD6BE|nr:probable transcription factor At4g00390 [Mangifera indica]
MEYEKRPHDSVEGDESKGQMNPTKKTKQHSSTKTFWSEDEEISILNTAIQFSNLKGLDPTAHGNRTQFYTFIKQSFSYHDFSKRQVRKKLKSLKKNFERNVVESKAFSDPHQNKVFELSLNLWGSKSISKDTPATANEEVQDATQIGSEVEEEGRVCDV